MREILFRGKRLDNGEWVEGFYIRTKRHHCIITGCINDGYVVYGHYANDVLMDVVDPTTVGQFTGLLDKAGKRIFEGDVVEYNNGYDYIKSEVVFEFGAFGIGSCEVIGISSGCCDNFVNLWQLFWDQEVTDEPELYYCKVIGNIYDNPELLKEGDTDGKERTE